MSRRAHIRRRQDSDDEDDNRRPNDDDSNEGNTNQESDNGYAQLIRDDCFPYFCFFFS